MIYRRLYRYAAVASQWYRDYWPLALRRTVHRLQVENHTLRDALRAGTASLSAACATETNK